MMMTESRMTLKRFVAMLLTVAMFLGCCPESFALADGDPVTDPGFDDSSVSTPTTLLGAGSDGSGDSSTQRNADDSGQFR